MAEETKHAILESPYPTTQTEIRFFLFLCSVYRRLAPGFSELASPLNKKLRNEDPTTSQNIANAVIQSVDELKSPLILFLLRTSGRYIIDNDVCDTQLGHVLF